MKKSKQQIAKEQQGYTREISNCSNCKNFICEVETVNVHWTVERNLRCSIGGFKVNKTATCDMWKKNEA